MRWAGLSKAGPAGWGVRSSNYAPHLCSEARKRSHDASPIFRDVRKRCEKKCRAAG